MQCRLLNKKAAFHSLAEQYPSSIFNRGAASIVITKWSEGMAIFKLFRSSCSFSKLYSNQLSLQERRQFQKSANDTSDKNPLESGVCLWNANFLQMSGLGHFLNADIGSWNCQAVIREASGINTVKTKQQSLYVCQQSVISALAMFTFLHTISWACRTYKLWACFAQILTFLQYLIHSCSWNSPWLWRLKQSRGHYLDFRWHACKNAPSSAESKLRQTEGSLNIRTARDQMQQEAPCQMPWQTCRIQICGRWIIVLIAKYDQQGTQSRNDILRRIMMQS